MQPKSPTQQILESGLQTQILRVSPERCSFYSTQTIMQNWKADGKFTVFQAGAFDLLTRNHLLGLAHTRILSAMTILNLTSIEDDHDLEVVHEMAGSGKIRLMVTMDANRAISQRKSRKYENGNNDRPVFDWETRAAMLAHQAFPTLANGRISMVDFITIHGSGCCPYHGDRLCVNENNADMAVALGPDLLVINAASRQTVCQVANYAKVGEFKNTKIVEVNEEDEQYSDPLLGGTIKTTAVVRRIKSYK